jgi:hypothetical protein
LGIDRTPTEADFQRFDGIILPFSAETARGWATMHDPDAKSIRAFMIVAIALRDGLALMRRKKADFGGIKIKLVNPW